MLIDGYLRTGAVYAIKLGGPVSAWQSSEEMRVSNVCFIDNQRYHWPIDFRTSLPADLLSWTVLSWTFRVLGVEKRIC